jgi:hypothetical protein
MACIALDLLLDHGENQNLMGPTTMHWYWKQ